MHTSRREKSHKRRPTNILVDGIATFLAQHDPRIYSNSSSRETAESILENPHMPKDSTDMQQDSDHVEVLVLKSEDIPKRYVLYHPMLLLNSTFASHSSAWQRFLNTLSRDQRDKLFSTIVDKFQSSGQYVTHIAANAPIERQVLCSPTATPEPDGKAIGELADKRQNVMRSPYNLQPLFGDFGPTKFVSSSGIGPSQADLNAAFWVETSQIPGIWQTWAPQWTMFSHGNVREKSRILGQQDHFPGLLEHELNQPLSKIDVVDFYVGIGYFAFSYLKRGVRRVFGWELNGWSVEGMKRGCEKNGWECLAVSVEDNSDDHELVVDTVAEALRDRPNLRCVVFQGDNKHAGKVLQSISSALEDEESALNIRHCNLGLLPTSRGSWDGAVVLLDSKQGGWLHIHENAEIAEVDAKRQLVLDALEDTKGSTTDKPWQITCAHTEMVKTYAPGVGHYVFDVKICPSR